MGIIYKSTNKINGRVYIGKTVRDFEHRKAQHKTQALNNRYNSYFHHAIRKYGWDNFDWEVIDFHDDEGTLGLMEEAYILFFDSYNNGYNLTRGGDGASGAKRSEETRRKLSEALSGENHPFYGKKRSAETRRKISEAHSGKKHSAETRKKMSEASKRENLSSETRKKLSEALSGENNPMYGKKHSAETLKKISEALYGKKVSAETRKKMSEARRKGNYPGTYYKQKNINPWRRVWGSKIKYRGKEQSLGQYEDPLSASLVCFLVWEELYGG